MRSGEPSRTARAAAAHRAAHQILEGGRIFADPLAFRADPPETLSPEAHAVFAQRSARVTELGEPWVTFFEPAELRAKLLASGFTRIDDLGPREIAARFFPSRAGDAPERGGHIVLAIRKP